MARTLSLSDAERAALTRRRDAAPKAYLRERAAALLKIADGHPAARVARDGLLRARDPDTLYAWLNRYRDEGEAGLTIRPGRGRKPAFSPHQPDQATAALQDVVGRDPRGCGHGRSRWTLDVLGATCAWLAGYSRSGISRVLAALGIVLSRARDHVHSPDPDYAAKRAAVEACVATARASAGRVATLFLDEVTIHRQPTLATAYAPRGPAQPLAERRHAADTLTRVVAPLDATDGRVCMQRRSHITVASLVACYDTLVTAYRDAERLYVVQDNWPVPAHPDLLVALEPQASPFTCPRPANWPDAPRPAAQRNWGDRHLPIQLVPWPTYASWLNPIEKLWRWMRQDLGHLHHWADDLPALRAAIDRCLARFAHGSADLLRYTGLHLPN